MGFNKTTALQGALQGFEFRGAFTILRFIGRFICLFLFIGLVGIASLTVEKNVVLQTLEADRMFQLID